MAGYTATYAVHKTLTATTPDTIVLTRWVNTLEILNRAGGSPLYVTWAQGANVPPDPVAGAVDVDVCPASQNIALDIPAGPVTVKILGNANDYSVQGRGN